ncbi:uncharacterized protein PHACADRAFT_179974 [Phanerochaete carnosa HHB-10118-sp]|uniref:Glycoside hydrolase family 76 protein n=1 Tax=Phanerochaete carnosa (strain HHB-10118-sp) TaxID=650164 RepID=K5WNP1_PHACS|nr:uncharacterized protein PHACADRAFT_179974 [Phanerochaete carnosa HHB-10118-sp]EKM60794.1 hypothetical protein PHACADRAFT_179974 [Phanerochaete carnosa HHB-10118-sp]
MALYLVCDTLASRHYRPKLISLVCCRNRISGHGLASRFDSTDGPSEQDSSISRHSAQQHQYDIQSECHGVRPEDLIAGLLDRHAYRKGYNPVAAQYALAAAVAYNSLPLMSYAVATWGQLSEYMVTLEDAASGSHPMRVTSIASTCNGLTTAGGVFYLTNQTVTTVNVETLGLSSYLATATGNQTYAAAAELSAEFIWNHLYNGTIILDGIDLHSCNVSSGVLSYNSGHTIEGLADISSRDQTWVPRPLSMVLRVKSDLCTEDHPSDEVDLAEVVKWTSTRPMKTFIIRGLSTAWNRSDPSSDMAKLIEAYVTVQYNVLLDLATYPGMNEYSSAWSGPPTSSLLPWGQLCALEAMRSEYAFALRSPDLAASATNTAQGTAATNTSPGLPSVPASRTSRSHAIIVATVGGVVLLLVVIAAFLFCHKRHKRRAEKVGEDGVAKLTPVPFEVSVMEHRDPKHGLSLVYSPRIVSLGAGQPQYEQAEFGVVPVTHEQVSATAQAAERLPDASSGHAVSSEDLNQTDINTVVSLLSHLLARVPQERYQPPPGYDE